MATAYTTYLQLRIKGIIEGQETINVLNFGTNSVVADDASGILLLQQLGQAMIECVVDTLLPAVPASWLFRGVDVRRLHPTPGDPVELNAAAGQVGALGESDVTFTTQLLRFSTGGGGRRGKGHMKLPPPPEGGVSASKLTAPQLALLLAFIACVTGKFVGQAATEPFKLIVLSRTSLKDAGGTYANSTRDVINITAEPLVASIRSRKIGKGS